MVTGDFFTETNKENENFSLIRAIYNDSGFDVVSKHKVTTFTDKKKIIYFYIFILKIQV